MFQRLLENVASNMLLIEKMFLIKGKTKYFKPFFFLKNDHILLIYYY